MKSKLEFARDTRCNSSICRCLFYSLDMNVHTNTTKTCNTAINENVVRIKNMSDFWSSNPHSRPESDFSRIGRF